MLTSTKYKSIQWEIKNNMQKLNTILEKEQEMKKIMAKNNMRLKAQNQILKTKMQEN